MFLWTVEVRWQENGREEIKEWVVSAPTAVEAISSALKSYYDINPFLIKVKVR